jgi:galactokinase
MARSRTDAVGFWVGNDYLCPACFEYSEARFDISIPDLDIHMNDACFFCSSCGARITGGRLVLVYTCLRTRDARRRMFETFQRDLQARRN